MHCDFEQFTSLLESVLLSLLGMSVLTFKCSSLSEGQAGKEGMAQNAIWSFENKI